MHTFEVPEFFLIFYQSAGRTRECVGKSKLFSYTCRKTYYMCHIKWKYEEHMQESSCMCHIKWKYEEHMQENFLHVSYKMEV